MTQPLDCLCWHTNKAQLFFLDFYLFNGTVYYRHAIDPIRPGFGLLLLNNIFIIVAWFDAYSCEFAKDVVLYGLLLKCE